jgi:hypothetical protein
MPANPKKRTPESPDALAYAENIIATLRERFVGRVVNEESRKPVESPTVRALRDGVISRLSTRTLRCSG